MRTLSAMLLAAAVATVASPALAGPLEDAVNARRGFYQLLGLHFGGLVAMAKGEAEYDAATAQSMADNLDALTSMNPIFMFPAGSDNGALAGQTRALPEIWSDFDGFNGKFVDLVGAVDGMVEAAGQGREALGAAAETLGGTCGACHRAYRARDF